MKKTAKFYRDNPESRKKKNEYQKKYNAKPENIKKRVELNAYNRDKGTYGNGDGKDAAHKGGRIAGFKSQSANRGSNSDSRGDKRARPKKKK